MFTSQPKIACINDLKLLAQKRVPKMFFQYAESGSYSQQTLKANATDFGKIKLRQRVAVDVSKRSTRPPVHSGAKRNRLETEVMYAPCPFSSSSSSSCSSSTLPIALSPIGLCGMQNVNGEIQAARAAAKHQIPFALSTMSITSIEDLRKHAHPELLGSKFFFQLYMMKDREFMRRLVQRAEKANCGALVLTLDLQILAARHSDFYNGLSAPPKLCNLQTLRQLGRRPRWCLNQALFAKRYNFGNIVEDAVLASKVDDISSLSSWTSGQFDPSIDWETVRWVRNELWNKDKPLIVKGILDEEDAIEACKVGVDAIIVSNHGGRQLDSAPSSISKLHSVKKAVDSFCAAPHNSSGTPSPRPAVHFDGGVSSGQDIFKALALGASSVWIGRSYVWGLGALGEEGVDQAIQILQKELDVTMALTGTSKLSEISLDKLVMTDEVKMEFGIIT